MRRGSRRKWTYVFGLISTALNRSEASRRKTQLLGWMRPLLVAMMSAFVSWRQPSVLSRSACGHYHQLSRVSQFTKVQAFTCSALTRATADRAWLQIAARRKDCGDMTGRCRYEGPCKAIGLQSIAGRFTT